MSRLWAHTATVWKDVPGELPDTFSKDGYKLSVKHFHSKFNTMRRKQLQAPLWHQAKQKKKNELIGSKTFLVYISDLPHQEETWKRISSQPDSPRKTPHHLSNEQQTQQQQQAILDNQHGGCNSKLHTPYQKSEQTGIERTRREDKNWHNVFKHSPEIHNPKSRKTVRHNRQPGETQEKVSKLDKVYRAR